MLVDAHSVSPIEPVHPWGHLCCSSQEEHMDVVNQVIDDLKRARNPEVDGCAWSSSKENITSCSSFPQLVGADWNMNVIFPFNWESSSQVTFIIFFRGFFLNHQPEICWGSFGYCCSNFFIHLGHLGSLRFEPQEDADTVKRRRIDSSP